MSFQSLLVSGSDAREVLAESRERLQAEHGRFNLGVVYLSDHLGDAAGPLLEGLREASGIEHWVGGTAIGVMGREGESFDRPAVSMLLARLPESCFRVFGPLRSLDEDPLLASWREARTPYVGLVHADPRYSQVPGLLRELSAGGSPYLVGGLLSSRSTYRHTGAGLGEGALSGALFDTTLAVTTRLSQGCSPFGPRHVISRADGSRLFELDGRPALEVLAADLEADGRGASDVHVALPRRGSDTGDYLVRNLMGVDAEHGALVVGEVLDTGAPLMFCRRNADAARRDLVRMLDELAAALPGPARGAVYVSCLARGPNLFDEPALELGLIRERFGGVPLAGFYANGEIAGDDLYGYTGVLTVFS